MRVFISYSSRDRRDALALKELAEADGHDAWMDLFDIRPAERLTSELEQGVSTADVLCVLLSPSAAASPWVRDELRCALAAEAQGLQVLPVILRSTAIPDELADHVAIDARRGLADASVSLRVRRALGLGHADDLLLDAVRRAELADSAAVDELEAALPRARAVLARVMDDPIRQLSVQIDQDTWPDGTSSVLEIVLAVDIFVGRLSILLAPYVEGRTWGPDSGFDERPAEDFLASTTPRVDARLSWAGRTLAAAVVRDGTDLGEQPMRFTFDLPGDARTPGERGSMSLLQRFELPSLRRLVDARSSVSVWLHRDGVEPEHVDPDRTDLGLRLEVPVRRDEDGVAAFRLWATHDHTDSVLLRAPSLLQCASEIEREALLSLHRHVPLRADLTSGERRRRLASTLEHGGPLDDADVWAAFAMATGRADLVRLRGDRQGAAELVHEAIGLLPELHVPSLDYPHAFRVITALARLVEDLAEAGGSQDAVVHYGDLLLGLTRELRRSHPDEADYARALSRAYVQRARLVPGTADRTAALREAVALLDDLVRADPLPWRVDEARELRDRCEAMLVEWGADREDLGRPPALSGAVATWLDPATAAKGSPVLVYDRLLRFRTGVPIELGGTRTSLDLYGEELLGRWGVSGSRSGLAVGLSDTTSDTGELVARTLAGTAPLPLPGGGTWSVLDAQEEQPPPVLVERLAASSLRAVRLALGVDGVDVVMRGYLLVVEKDGLRWRVCVTLERSGRDWRSRAADDAVAAVVFGRLHLT